MMFFGASTDLSAAAQAGDAQQAAMVAAIINPLVQTIMPGVGQAFLLYGGIVAAVGAAVWATGFFIRCKYTRVTPFDPGPKPPATPLKPTQSSSHQAPPASPAQPAKTMPRPQTPPRVIQ